MAGSTAGDDGIEDDEQLAHDGGDRRLEGSASGDQAIEQGLQMGVVADGDGRGHVEGLAGRCASGGDVASPRGRWPGTQSSRLFGICQLRIRSAKATISAWKRCLGENAVQKR